MSVEKRGQRRPKDGRSSQQKHMERLWYAASSCGNP